MTQSHNDAPTGSHKRTRARFVSGLLVLVPLAITLFILRIIVAALTTGVVVQSSLNELTQASGEINSVASVLDSVTGLRSLLISFSR